MNGQYLTFDIGAERFALPIAHVEEIIAFPEAARLPNSPSYLRGLINLRGTVMAVIDLRRFFGLADDFAGTAVVIVGRVGPRNIGFLVDSVDDVVTLDAAACSTLDEVTPGYNPEYVSGIFRSAGRLLIRLNVDRVLSEQQLGALDAVEERPMEGI